MERLVKRFHSKFTKIVRVISEGAKGILRSILKLAYNNTIGFQGFKQVRILPLALGKNRSLVVVNRFLP